MGQIPMRAIMSVATLVGVVTMGVVVILGAPPSPADRVRAASERAARARELTSRIRESIDDGRLTDAERLTKRQIREFPDDASTWLYYSLVQQRLGVQANASKGWDRLLELTSQSSRDRFVQPSRMILEGWALYGKGDREGARWVWGLATEISRQRPGGGQAFYQLARQLALDGENDDALQALHMALDAGFRQLMVLEADPAMRPLQEEARYLSAIDRLKRTRMGSPVFHGETDQVIRSPRPASERLRAWVEQWGDL